MPSINTSEWKHPYQKLWYERKKQEDPEFLVKRCTQSRETRLRHPEKRMFWAARSRAKDKGLEFNITLCDIEIPDKCPILGVPLEHLTRYAPSLDRIDSSKGYIKGNIWVISRKANSMKQDASSEDLRKFAEWVNKSQA